jgi:hypothetical protein
LAADFGERTVFKQTIWYFFMMNPKLNLFNKLYQTSPELPCCNNLQQSSMKTCPPLVLIPVLLLVRERRDIANETLLLLQHMSLQTENQSHQDINSYTERIEASIAQLISKRLHCA